MNRLLIPAILLVGLLASCSVTVEPVPVPTLRALDLTYQTSYLVNGQPAICDNRSTQIVYRFHYEGNLERWSSYLEGQTLGRVALPRTFTPRSADVSPYQTAGYEVTYNLVPNTAPYAVNPDAVNPSTLSPQGIVVTPVPVPVPNLTPIGTAKLYLTLEGSNGETQPFASAPIPVYIKCS